MFKSKFIMFSILLLTFSVTVFSQGFENSSTGEQTFNFKDDMGRNQAAFFSNALLENINGLSNDLWGEVSFDPNDIQNSLAGYVSISTKSLKSGIERRDEDLHGENWLDADKYPVITFKIKEISNIQQTEPNKIRTYVVGEFSLHGRTKSVQADVTMTYLRENEMTKKREPGDLLGVQAKFKIKLADFGIRHMLIGTRVADEIEITANIVGSNFKQ